MIIYYELLWLHYFSVNSPVWENLILALALNSVTMATVCVGQKIRAVAVLATSFNNALMGGARNTLVGGAWDTVEGVARRESYVSTDCITGHHETDLRSA